MEFVRTEKEINQLLNECSEVEDMGTNIFPRMTYEQGIPYLKHYIWNAGA